MFYSPLLIKIISCRDYIQKTYSMARKIKKALHKGIIMQGSLMV